MDRSEYQGSEGRMKGEFRIVLQEVRQMEPRDKRADGRECAWRQGIWLAASRVIFINGAISRGFL